MAIEFECPVCGATIRVKDEAAGKKGRCPKCKTLLLVPEPELEADPSHESSHESSVTGDGLRSSVDSAVTPADPPSPAPDPPSTAFHSDMPFVLADVPDPPRADRPEPPRRSPRGAPRLKIASVAAAVVGAGAVLLGGWLIYRNALRASGPMTGERLAEPSLPEGSFGVPSDVPKDAADRVLSKLTADDLSLKSEYVVVTLTGGRGVVDVVAAPGPQAVAVRVSLGDKPTVKEALSKHRDRISAMKRQELESAATELFNDYFTAFTQKRPLGQASRYRDAVAFNALNDVLGYSVEAVIAGQPFRSVAEDANGSCYFLLPLKTRAFRIRGRQLPDGSVPVDVDAEVVIRNAGTPKATRRTDPPEPETSEQPDRTESPPSNPTSTMNAE